jgi:5-methyltetrahydrofolate--homocysteine methyltransferase
MIVIGEKINATLAPVKTMILERDTNRLADLARQQERAGADFIDVNVGTGVGSQKDEMDAIQWALECICNAVDTALCIDSADPRVIATGLDMLNGQKAMINSVNAEQRSLEEVLPLAADTEALLIALAMDEKGIATREADRIRCCEKIYMACQDHAIQPANVFLDPLVMPISTDVTSAKVTLNILTAIKNEFPGLRTVTGLSNVSYGLPQRRRLNIAFLHMCIATGLDAAIVDPLESELMAAIKTGEVLVGKDRHCRKYLRAFRQKN